MSLTPHARLSLRRQADNDMAAMLTSIYQRLRRASMSQEQAYRELLYLLENRLDNLNRMGIPPAWERYITPEEDT